MSGAGFERAVIELAQRTGWAVVHMLPIQDTRGRWRTGTAADGKGFPDLIAVNMLQGRIIFRELKSGAGRLSPEQKVWIEKLGAVGCDVGVWRSDDWPTIERELIGA